MPANALIAARIAQPDMQGLGAESIVAALNAPDPSLPAVVERRPTRIGPGSVMAALGATEGALLLDTLTVLAAQSRPIHWALQIIQRGELDLSVPNARAQIDAVLEGFEHHAIRFDHIVTRRAGQRRFVDLHMHMPAAWTLGRAAAVRTSVEQALMSAVPGLRATIQLLPLDVEAHFGDAKDPL